MNKDFAVHIVDDDRAFRESTEFLLQDAGLTVIQWTNGTEFVSALKEARRGCVLLDLRMPGLDGLAVQKIIRERRPDLSTIVLAGHGDISSAVATMKAGALDFIEKPFRRSTLLSAIYLARARVENAGAPDWTALEAQRRIAMLSPREQEILQLLVQGHSNKQIALLLKISPRTVEVHRANLMTKLGVYNLPSALRIALASGTMSPQISREHPSKSSGEISRPAAPRSLENDQG